MIEVRATRGRRGIVVAGHVSAAEAGRDQLAAGGNAVDAAVAAAAVLAVVCPYACTIGGDLFALILNGESGSVVGLNASGAAPAKATEELYADGIPRTGPLSISVPGFVAGLGDMCRRHGTRGLAELLAPAIGLARAGFPAHSQHVQNARSRAELLAADPAAARLFLPGGAPPAEGDLVRQPELAESLAAIAERGVPAFYEGEMARRMAEAVAAVGGVLTADDFGRHQSLWQSPMAINFAGHEVSTMPPNSYGLTLLLQLLEMQAGGIGVVDPTSAEFVLRGLKARRNAYRVADGVIGEPATLEVPARELLAAAIGSGLAPGRGSPAESRDRGTSCVVVIDERGNAVSLIQSVSAPFGSGIVAPGTGILLNNRMAGFSAKPGHPNRVGPGKRPAHTLAPCLVTRGGKAIMAIGTPGTVGQTCTLAQIIARILACGEDIATAIASPRWSVTLEGKPAVEKAMSEGLCAAIAAVEPSLEIMPTGWIAFGSVKIAAVDDFGFAGYADSRRVAAPAAW